MAEIQYNVSETILLYADSHKKKAQFKITLDEKTSIFKCTITLDDEVIGEDSGENEKIAKERAALKA